MKHIYNVSPPRDPTPVSVTVLTYADQVHVSVAARRSLPSALAITKGILAEFENQVNLGHLGAYGGRGCQGVGGSGREWEGSPGSGSGVTEWAGMGRGARECQGEWVWQGVPGSARFAVSNE